MVNHYAVSPSQSGGTRHFTLGRELVRRGHDVTIVASNFDYQTAGDRLPPGEVQGVETVEGVRFLWLRTPPYRGNTIGRLRNMLAFAARVRGGRPMAGLGRPDVVLGSSPHPFAALAAQSLARRHRVPFVLEVRDLWPQSLVDLGNISTYHPFILLLSAVERRLYRGADRIVSLLPNAAPHMVARGASAERIAIVPNGVDLSSVGDPEPPGPSELFTVAYAGAHGVANDLGTVLEAAALLRGRPDAGHIRFRLIGDGPLKPALKAEAAARGLANVAFDDALPKDMIHAWLQRADAFLMPLKDSPTFRWGVSPNKLFDYLASARPVVYAVNSSNNPVADAGAGVVVPPSDAQAMAGAVLQLAGTPPAERWAMGLRGRDYAMRNHTFPLLAEKLERVLAEAVRRS